MLQDVAHQAFPPFHEVFLRILSSDRIFPYPVKCFLLGIMLYLPGLLISYSKGFDVLHLFVTNYGFLMASIAVGATLAALIRFFKKLGVEIMLLNNAVLQSDAQKFDKYVNHAIHFHTRRISSRLWYYLDSFGGAGLGFVLSAYFMHPWWLATSNRSSAIALLTTNWLAVYLVVWGIILGYITGVAVHRVAMSIYIMREYCRNFLLSEKIIPLNPDKTGGLKILGNLALELDMAVAIPSFVAFGYFAETVIKSSILPSFGFALAFIYTIFLGVVFFLPLSPAHDAMLKAKKHALLEINNMFSKTYDELRNDMVSRKSLRSSKHLTDLRELYFLYEHIENMAVWPLNLGILSKYVATSLFPIIGTLIIDVIFRLLAA